MLVESGTVNWWHAGSGFAECSCICCGFVLLKSRVCVAVYVSACLVCVITLLCDAGTVEFLRKLELDNDSLTKSIIGTIGDVDSYQLPDSKGRTAFMRHILSISDAERQERREQILGTSLKDFR